MEHLRTWLAHSVSAVGGPAAASKAWGIERRTLFYWLQGKHPPSLKAIQRVIVTLPIKDRYALFQAIEADAEAAARGDE